VTNRKVHPLRKVFDEAERAVGGPIEHAINTPTGGSMLLAAARVTHLGLRPLRAVRSTVVHLAELPTHRDVELLSAKIGRLQRSVDELTQQVQELEGKPAGKAPS
jgi:hypothetical protein